MSTKQLRTTLTAADLAASGQFLTATSTDAGADLGHTTRAEAATALVGQFPSGTAGAPAYSFAGDLNTGMFRLDANQMGFATNGALRLCVSNPAVPLGLDNVGIGTNNPLMGLHVARSTGNATNGGLDGNPGQFIIRGNNYFDVPNLRNQPIVNGFQSSIGLSNTDGFITLNVSTSSVNVGDAATLVERLRINNDGVVRPGGNGTQDFGSASFRWKDIYATNTTIQTSDAREKTEVRDLTADEIAAAKDLAREIGAFKFLAAIELKGEGARNHIGMTVQKAIEIMEAHHLDPFAYGFICYDEWEAETIEHPAVEAVEATEESEAVEAQEAWTETTLEAGNRYGFRATELLLFIARGFEARLSALEAND